MGRRRVGSRTATRVRGPGGHTWPPGPRPGWSPPRTSSLGTRTPRPGAGGLIERSVATLRAAGVTARPRVRGDVGYFAKDIAWAAVDNGCDFSLGITRNPAAWRAAAAIADDAWTEAVGMKDIPGRRGR